MNPDGTFKVPGTLRASWTYAQKMRAAMTSKFAEIPAVGKTPWHYDDVAKKMKGNPSISTQVSSYMLSLHKRKVRDSPFFFYP